MATGLTPEQTRDLVRAIQKAMADEIAAVDEVSAIFEADQIEALRCVIRIVLEVCEGLINQSDVRDLQYHLDTVISGIESFQSLVFSYRALEGAQESRLDWPRLTDAEMIPTILKLREQFLGEANFIAKCRLLLDLYKLELAVVAIHYG